MTRSNMDALDVIGEHMRELGRSHRIARMVGVPELAQARRLQLMALRDVRRDLLGQAS